MLHKVKNHEWITLLFLLLTIFHQIEANYISLTVQTSSTQINLPSTYTFTFNRQYDPVNFAFIPNPTAVPIGTSIIITLPSQFITISSGSTLSCINTANSQSLTCNVNTAAKTITITDYYSTSSTLTTNQIIINVYNLINAYKAGPSDNFYWQIVSPNNTVIDQGPAINSNVYSTSITFTAGQFISCSISASGAYVSSYSPLLFNIYPANPIPTSGQLIIILPQFWSSDPLQSSTLISSPSCTAISNTSSSITCSYNFQSSQFIITISSLSSASLSNPFSLQIANILIPPTVGSSQTIAIYSQWPDGTQIDTCTSKINDILVVPFQGSSLKSNDNTTIQSKFTSTLSLTLSRNFYYQDSIILTFPSIFIDAQISSATLTSFTKSSNLNVITLTNFPSVPQVIALNNIISFILSNINNPISTAPISIIVGIYRNSQIYQQSTVTYSATSTSVNSFGIAASSNFVQNVGQATITITSVLQIPANSVIYITYPSSMTASVVSITNVTLATLNGTVIIGVTYQISNNQIIFRNIFSVNFIGTIVLIINKFTNPPTIQPSNYLLTISDSSGYVVMTGSTTITASTKTLISNLITASSYKVLQTGVTYTASISTNFAFTSVTIIVPSEITIGSGFQATCAPSFFSSCTLSGNNLTFYGTLAAGNYSLQWGYVTNPNSFSPTSSFQIYTYNNGYGVQNSQGVLLISMSNTTAFSNVILYPSSYSNSVPISITIILTFPTNAPAGQLTILVPSVLILSSASCSGCTISSSNIYINVGILNNLTITINNVTNVGSFKPVDDFIISLSNSGGYSSLYSKVTGWTNNQPSTYSTSVTGNNNYQGQLNNFKFQLTGLTGSQTLVIINIDSAFSPLTTAPSGFQLINSYSLQIGCTGTSCSFNFTIVNPTIIGYYVFTLTTLTSDNYKVGVSTSNSWTFDCATTNCRSCYSNSSCLTCYNSTISSYYIFNTFTNTCDRACSPGYFLVNTTCTKCDSNCSQCTNTSKTCTTCPNGYFLDKIYNLCVLTCTSGYFANALNLVCTVCTSPCSTCSGTSSFCLSCISGTYLYNSSCLTTCPKDYFIANTVTLRCDACNSNCLTCSNTTTFCLTCNNTLGLYFENNVCRSNCSYNYFLVNNICTYCALPCKICSGSINSCSSCYINSTNPIFFNSFCISSNQCPIGHYVNSTNLSCEVCPTNCSQCTSSTVCSSCSLGYYLYGTLCLSTCPNITYINSNSSTGICSPCNSCLTCSSAFACTSCIASQFLYNSICYSICPNGSYASSTICSACSNNCLTCQNYTYCTSCVTSMSLYKGVCYLYCPNATYPNTTLQVCSNCPASCSLCTSLTVCQSCATNYSLQNSQCVLICSLGLSYNQVCYPCGLNCDICSNTTCSKCTTSHYLYNNTCPSQCPSNMLTLDNMNCVLCTVQFVNCSTCTNTKCLTCTYGQLTGGNCVPCSPGYYAQSGACTTCPSTCATCESQTYCTSCTPNHYLLNNFCLTTCPLNMVPNGTTCTNCLANCNICNQVTSLCTVCTPNYYLYNNLCFSSCPSPLIVSYDFLTCVTEAVYYAQFSSAAKIVPFPFTIGSCLLIIIGVILKCFHKQMHLQTLLCAIISIIQISTWIIFIAFEYMYYSNYHKLSFFNLICGIVGVGFLMVINIIHLIFYCKYIKKDNDFIKWYKKNSCSNSSFLTVATILNFKFYRFVHSKFLGRQQTSMILSSHNKLVPFSMVSIFSIIFCSIPAFAGCALALYNSIAQDQQFYIALDTITVTGLMIILIIMDLKHSDDYFVDEHEAKNLKKKVYQQDQIKFGQQVQNPMQENISHQHLIQIQQDEGDMSLPPSATKFQSNFEKSNTQILGSDTKLKQGDDIGSQQNIMQQQQQQSDSRSTRQNIKWKPKIYDHYGYLIKYDSNNNPIKYDENGYRVQIDQNGKHHKYNQYGEQMILINGKYIPHDKDGYKLINGKRYNNKGYQIRQQNGKLIAYDQYGFKVIGEGQNQRHIDQDGNIIIINQNGQMKRYDQNGWQITNYKDKKVLKNKKGQYVRLNKNGQWQIYDPQDNLILKPNPKTGKYSKYNELGFRVSKDQYGNLHYYDEDDNKITILPGGQIIRHDKNGYRIQKDENGQIHRYDEDGYQFIQDENGNFMFIDKNGYRVERDIYGHPTLYDKDGNQIRIDPQTKKHRKYNDEGLQIITDIFGNNTLVDKRGRIVKQYEDTYQKYDKDGNKIWLDENGYQIQQDQQGNIQKYDKIGDRIITQYQIQQFDNQNHLNGNLMINTNTKQLKYKYKSKIQSNQEQQLNKLLSIHQPIQFQDQQEQISQLHQFHDNYFQPNQNNIDQQLNKIVNKQRSQLIFKEQENNVNLEELEQFQHQEELYGNLVQPNIDNLDGLLNQHTNINGQSLINQPQNSQKQFDNQLFMKHKYQDDPLGLKGEVQMGNHSLHDKQQRHGQFDNQLLMRQIEDKELHIANRQFQSNFGLALKEDSQGDFDKQFALKNLDEKEPEIHNKLIDGNGMLIDHQHNKQSEFDKQFTFKDLDAMQPEVRNRWLQAHHRLIDKQQNKQGQYDKEALVKQIDENQPDILLLKAKDQQRSELARRKAIDHNLKLSREQDQIQIKSVADISVDQRSFENEGVQPLQNRTDFDEINSLDELQIPLGRKQRGNRSEVSLISNKKNTQTVYNYNTVEVEIKNQNNLYNQDEEIQSLHEEDWQQQMNPMVFSRRQRVKDQNYGNNSNANTNIVYIEDDAENNDALSDFVQQTQSKSKLKSQQNNRHKKMNDILSRQVESIEEIQQRLFKQAHQREMRQRRQFKLSGGPNPLVQYAKTIQANKKTLQQKMYLDHNYKKK